ncbi:MAG: HAMP domain-containing sensor histidine kinase [Clostridiaceae bacterium]|nr:HAMP domain-containing sensor histidine kinase [Clostridiaceae bacterium]
MNNNNEFKKVKSTAIRINSSFISKLFWKFLILDIVTIALVTIFWTINVEQSYFGEFTINAKRSYDFYPLETAVYECTVNGDTLRVDATSFCSIMENVSIYVLSLEGLMILKELIFGTSKIRRKLRFLNEIAEKAEKLSEMTFDERKMQDIEEAIFKISPTASNDNIHIEDNELSGLENAINNLLQRMRESYRQQARFVSDASHELRTPIAVIQGYANMLDRWGKEDEKVLNESIDAIKSESENMKILVEQLLFLARGINGKTKVNAKNFSLLNMMKEVLEESKMIDEDHIYYLKGEEEISAFADESLLKEVMRILIENAKKYTPKGESIKLAFGKKNDEIYLLVQDNGIGMEENDIPHIFDRFFRADTSRVRKTGGTGLGLSIAKWIVDNHNGYFSVLSRKDIGTRIVVYIPQDQKL